MTKNKENNIVTRFAPSPTGFLHVGGLRTALYTYLFAKKNKGKFLLRIEDTDQSRKVEGATEGLQDMLKAFDLNWDNHDNLMIQSERTKIYQEYAEKLIKENKAYHCFCTPERLQEVRESQQKNKQPTMYDKYCQKLSAEEIKKNLDANQKYVVRLKVPEEGSTNFNDIVRGDVGFENKLIDDQVLLKSDGFPTYHLANVIDDHEMKITHVIRGEEWLPSTPKHILLYTAFGWEVPEFSHLPLLLNPDKSKLSKRQGDVAVEDYLEKGYLKEALLNFILLLGWNPGDEKEIFSTEEMIESFDLKKVNKAGSVFDTTKLDWLNGYYIRHKSLGELITLCQGFFDRAGVKIGDKNLDKIIAVEQERLKRLDEIVLNTQLFFETPQYESSLLLWKKMTTREALNSLKLLEKTLGDLDNNLWDQKNLEEKIREVITKNELKVGEMLWPMRVALSGQKNSPGPFEIAEILEKSESLKRINTAINLLEKL